MRSPPLLALLLCAGCVSGGGSEPLSGPPRVLSSGGSYDVRVTSNDEASVQVIRATPAQAWDALPRVFEALDVPITHMQEAQHLMGNRDFTASRRLGGDPLERFLNCGSTISGPITSNHTVKLSLLVQVLPSDGGQSQLSTRVEGRATSRQGVSGSVLACGSTGRLEAKVAELLNAAVGA